MGFNSQRKRGSAAPVAPGTSVRGGVHSSTHPADRGGRGLWAQKRYTSMTSSYIYIYVVTYIMRYLVFCMYLPYQIYIYIYSIYIYMCVCILCIYIYMCVCVCVYMWLLSPGRSAPRDVLRLSGWLDVSWCPRRGRWSSGGFPVDFRWPPVDMVIWWWFYYKTIGKWWFNHYKWWFFMVV